MNRRAAYSLSRILANLGPVWITARSEKPLDLDQVENAGETLVHLQQRTDPRGKRQREFPLKWRVPQSAGQLLSLICDGPFGSWRRHRTSHENSL